MGKLLWKRPCHIQLPSVMLHNIFLDSKLSKSIVKSIMLVNLKVGEPSLITDAHESRGESACMLQAQLWLAISTNHKHKFCLNATQIIVCHKDTAVEQEDESHWSGTIHCFPSPNGNMYKESILKINQTGPSQQPYISSCYGNDILQAFDTCQTSEKIRCIIALLIISSDVAIQYKLLLVCHQLIIPHL